MGLVEGLIQHVFKTVIDVELDSNFERLTYAEAMRRFGKDAPDLRFGMELAELRHLARGRPERDGERARLDNVEARRDLALHGRL